MSRSTHSTFVPAARRLLLAASLSTVPMLLFAQQPASPQNQAQGQTQDQGSPAGAMRRGAEMHQRQLDQLTRTLSLTPDQVTQVKAIQEGSRPQMMALRQNTSLSPEERHIQMMALHQAEMTQVEAILTPEQKTKFEDMRARMEQRRDEHHGAERMPPPPPPSM